MNYFLNYKDLFSFINLKKYQKIIVSGSQRSGTTFLSQVLSEDLNFIKVDQNKGEIPKLEYIEKIPAPFVAQAPHLSWRLHEITTQDTFVIFVARNCNDVIHSAATKLIKSDDKSQNWNNSDWGNLGELVRLQKWIKLKKLPDYYNNIHSCYLKHNLWLSHQIPNMQVDFATVPYESLQDHPKFISDKNLRKLIPATDIKPKNA